MLRRLLIYCSACARQAACPKRVVFVLKETEPERWISNGGDFYAYLKPPGVDEVVEKVCNFLWMQATTDV